MFLLCSNPSSHRVKKKALVFPGTLKPLGHHLCDLIFCKLTASLLPLKSNYPLTNYEHSLCTGWCLYPNAVPQISTRLTPLPPASLCSKGIFSERCSLLISISIIVTSLHHVYFLQQYILNYPEEYLAQVQLLRIEHSCIPNSPSILPITPKRKSQVGDVMIFNNFLLLGKLFSPFNSPFFFLGIIYPP